MTTAENKALVRQLYEAANAGDYAAMRRLTTPEYGEQLVTATQAAKAQFDAPWQVLDVVAEGEQVAVHWKREGTHTGAFHGLAPTGKPAAFDGIRLFRLAGGKVAASVGATNTLELVRALSAAPATE
jgi:predicted ester cyclase